jgi:hypothetical protein
MVRELRETHQKIFRRAYQALLFTRIDTLGGGAETHTAPVTDLNEDQLLVGQHDQVQFATAAAVIARHTLHALSAEQGLGATFPARSRTRLLTCLTCLS